MAKSQREIDAKAIAEKKAVGANDEGGQNNITPGQRVNKSDQPPFNAPRFRGMTLHDKDKDTWGLSKLERYEH